MNELVEKNKELYLIFENIYRHYSKSHKIVMDAKEAFLNPAIRRGILNDYAKKHKREVDAYLAKENELEFLEQEIKAKFEHYNSVRKKIINGEITLDILDSVKDCLASAYEAYQKYFEGQKMIINSLDASEDDTTIYLTSSAMSNSLHSDIHFSLELLDKNVNHILGLLLIDGNKKPNLLLRLYTIMTGNPSDKENFNNIDFLNFVIKDGFRYLKYLMGSKEKITSVEKAKLDAFNIDIFSEIKGCSLDNILLKSAIFLKVYKYKFIPEVICDYSIIHMSKKGGLKEINNPNNKNNRNFDLDQITKANNSKDNESLNPNYYIVSYDAGDNILSLLKIKYYTILAICLVLSRLEIDTDLKPETKYVTSLQKVNNDFENIKTSHLWEYIMYLAHNAKETLDKQMITKTVYGDLDVNYLGKLFLEIKDGALIPDVIISPEMEEVLNKILSKQNFQQTINVFLENFGTFNSQEYLENPELLHNILFENVEIPTIRDLIPLVHYLFLANEKMFPRANIIGFVINNQDQYAKTIQDKTFIQLELDLRKRGYSYLIDSVIGNSVIYHLTTIKQYENQRLMFSDRLTLCAPDISFHTPFARKVMPILFSTALALSGVSYNEAHIDVSFSDIKSVTKENLTPAEDVIIGSDTYLKAGTVYKESSDADYGGAKKEGVVTTSGDYPIEAFSIIKDGKIIYSSFSDVNSLDTILIELANDYNVSVDDFEIYYHYGYPIGGWIKAGDIVSKENVLVKTSYSATTNNNVITFMKDSEVIFINLQDKEGNLIKENSIVMGSDGNQYVVEKVNLIIDKRKIDEIITSGNLNPETLSFDVKDLNPLLALGTFLSIVYYYRKK